MANKKTDEMLNEKEENKPNMKLIAIAAVLIMVVAAFLFLNSQNPLPNKEDPRLVIIKADFLKSLVSTNGVKKYNYEYTESINGYKTTTTLVNNGSEMYFKLATPLFLKETYFQDNQTIVCSQALFRAKGCVVAENDSTVTAHLGQLKGLFFNDAIALSSKASYDSLIQKGLVIFEPETTVKIVNNVSCNDITFIIDYSNLTLSDAAQYGISSSSPKIFHGSTCTSDEGVVQERTFRYTFGGTGQTNVWTLVNAEFNKDQKINVPSNMSEGITAFSLLSFESELNGMMDNCYANQDADTRNKCISNNAIDLVYPPLCGLAGSRSDQCYLNLVSLGKDTSLCNSIGNLGTKDDCYIEIAGSTKTSAYCSSVANETKKTYCLNVSTSKDETPNVETNNTAINSSSSDAADNTTNVTAKKRPDYVNDLLEE
ncbi:MAG: hypothetical protein Q7S22_05895 [Candidatus Micrarchaeota archaeon]|nr:hypothetical protein [Candidatus Micrarchaeota archaeon]